MYYIYIYWLKQSLGWKPSKIQEHDTMIKLNIIKLIKYE